MEMGYTIDIQDAHKRHSIGVLANGGVDLVDQPVKHARVQGLRQGVPVVRRRLHIDGAHYGTCTAPTHKLQIPPTELKISHFILPSL